MMFTWEEMPLEVADALDAVDLTPIERMTLERSADVEAFAEAFALIWDARISGLARNDARRIGADAVTDWSVGNV